MSLRRDVKDWSKTLADRHPELPKRRIATPELQQRAKAPCLAWFWILAGVDLPEFAHSEHELKQQLEQEQAKLDELSESQNDAETALTEINRNSMQFRVSLYQNTNRIKQR